MLYCEVDVQVGNGRFHYINGYAAKDRGVVDVGLGEHFQKCSTASWLATHRLPCRRRLCTVNVVIRMAQLPELERSYGQVLL